MLGLPALDWQTALILAQDGVTTGAVYALVALSLVLVFSVTRVIFVAQGTFVVFGSLTVASLEGGSVPGTVPLLVVVTAMCVASALRAWVLGRAPAWQMPAWGVPGAGIAGLAYLLAPLQPGLAMQVILTLLLVVPLGPMIYQLAFRPVAGGSILRLNFTAVAVLLTLQGSCLLFFGPEGHRTQPFTAAMLAAGPLVVPGQSLWIFGVTAALLAVLGGFFRRTLLGKALRGTAVNRTGARLVAIPVQLTGMLAFALAAFLGACSGILIGPTMTVYFDSGFPIVLKAMVGAVIGGMLGYGAAVAGSLGVGVAEAFAAYASSGFADTIVFTLLLPILLLRSLNHVDREADRL